MYSSQDEFLASDHSSLNCKPENIWIYSNNLCFVVRCIEDTYSCVINNISSNRYFNFDSSMTIRELLTQDVYDRCNNFRMKNILLSDEEHLVKWGNENDQE